MSTTVLEPCGVEVTGWTLDDVTGPAVTELRQMLADRGVVVLRDQSADDHEFLAFLHRFGEPVFTEGETPVEGFPDLNVISNVGRSSPPRSVFHVDSSYFHRPPAYTALRAVRIPARGGQTLFTNQYDAYETLPDPLRRRLTGRTVRHVVTGVDPASLAPGAEIEAQHPVFLFHPLSGRTSLYLSTPERCVSISGLDPDEGRDVLARLYAHSTAPGNVLRHTWAPGDVVMWDNAVVMHKADHSDVEGERVMHRGMVTL